MTKILKFSKNMLNAQYSHILNIQIYCVNGEYIDHRHAKFLCSIYYTDMGDYQEK